MKVKKISLVCLVGFLTATQSMAMDLTNQKDTKKNNPFYSSLNATNSENSIQNYVDFSGKWEGSCNGKKVPMIEIKNGYSQIFIDSKNYVIGGDNAHSSVLLTLSTHDNYSFDWSGDKQTLIMHFFQADRSMILTQSGLYNSRLEVDFSKQKMTLSSGQLIIEGMRFKSSPDTDLTQESYSCTYQRA